MAEPTRITSVQNSRVKAVTRLLREHKERRTTGRFVAEGSRQIQRALAAGLRLCEVYECVSLPRGEDVIVWPEDESFLYFEVSEQVMGKMAYRENPETLLAVFAQPEPRWSLKSFVIPSRGAGNSPSNSGGGGNSGGDSGAYDAAKTAATGDSGGNSGGGKEFWLVMVGTTKPGNLGAMARTAAAAGVTGVIVADAVVDALNPNAIHASTGAVFSLPILAGTTEEILAFLDRRNVRILATVVGATQNYTQVDLTGSVALVIGAEDTGLDERWRQAAEAHGACVMIPMADSAVDSLNAANAAAIVLFEAVRQRRLVRC